MNDYQPVNNELFNEDKLVSMPVIGLRIGMRVSELDKPWAESSFLFQGFTIESQSDIDALKEECTYVYIEREDAKKMSMVRGEDAPIVTDWGGQAGGRNL